jgi:hypothetical protein
MSKARILADLISDSQITASEITGLELNAIQEGDTIVEVSDTGSGGKVVVRVDGADNAEFNAGGIKVPSGTTAERDPNAVVGSLRYNTTTGFFETFTGSGWGAVATPPSITGITPSNFDGAAGSTFTVDGAFFDTATTAVLKGADGTEYAAATVTYVSSTQITITNATNLPVANEPFRVSVTNGAGLSVESTQGIDAGSIPAFTTAAGTIATTTRWDEAVSVTVQATDAESTISGYAVTEGNLPSGLSLNATTGAITGTSTEQTTTTYTFTIEATDSAGNTNTRQFNIQIVNAAPVWNSPAASSTLKARVSQAANISLSATDPEGEAVSYTSSNLPSGLSISGSSIVGTPSAESIYNVSVSASDGFSSVSRIFNIDTNIPPPGEGFLDLAGQYAAPSFGSSNYASATRLGLPVINFTVDGVTEQWLLWAAAGTNPLGAGTNVRSYFPSQSNSTIPTSSSIVTTDWSQSRQQSQYGAGGYKDNGTSGWNNMYNTHPYSQSTASSNWGTIVPPETTQHLIVWADNYRSNDNQGVSGNRPGAVGTYNFNGGGFATDGIASWRGSVDSFSGPNLNDGTRADMYVSGEHTANSSYYVYVLEAKNTIATIGFVLIRVKEGTTSLSFT